MTRKNVLIASLAAPMMIAILLLAASPSVKANDQPAAANAEVKIDNFSFGPATLTIPAGTTVTWTNTTGAPHTVTSDDGTSFDSNINTPISANGGTFSFTFTKAGTFTYHCQIHPFMKATIIVQ